MSWYQLLNIYKENERYFEYYASVPPTACPRCGEPLRQAPQAADVTLYCKFDGWEYPRDYVRPQIL